MSARSLGFRAAGRVQFLPADAVREVVRLPRTTRVPHAPQAIVGLANVRGAALPILSLAALQGAGAATGDRVLVLDRAQPVGLLVDEVREVADAEQGAAPLDVEALMAGAFRHAPARVATPRPRPAEAPAREARRPTLDILSFDTGGQEFALPLDQVIEVLAVPPAVTVLPDADAAVIGTIERRGALLPIVSLARLLRLDAGQPARIVVATLKGHRIGLAVDAMRSVLRVDEAAVDPVPGVIARRAAEARIQAIARIEEGRRLVSILAADHLFDEALVAGLPHRRETAREEEDAMQAETSEPFLIFRLGEQSFGLPVAAVEEVVRLPETLTRLPRAPGFVEGVMNLRGRAIPVIDQRRRFGAAGEDDRRRRAIVVRLGTLQAAFIVDEVSRIDRIDAAHLAPAPDLSSDTRIFDRTATMADGSIVLLIEPAELLDGTERELLTALNADPLRADP